ncbi:unnamed protein product, partial [Closterium sp. Yama58-4]
ANNPLATTLDKSESPTGSAGRWRVAGGRWRREGDKQRDGAWQHYRRKMTNGHENRSTASRKTRSGGPIRPRSRALMRRRPDPIRLVCEDDEEETVPQSRADPRLVTSQVESQTSSISNVATPSITRRARVRSGLPPVIRMPFYCWTIAEFARRFPKQYEVLGKWGSA